MYRFPMVPSANRYWRSYRGRMIVSDEARNYKDTFKMLARCSEPPIKLLSGPVKVELHVYRARRSGDLDNKVKVACDSMEGVFFSNDAQIRELHAYLHDDRHDPRIEISVVSLLNSAG